MEEEIKLERGQYIAMKCGTPLFSRVAKLPKEQRYKALIEGLKK